MIIDPSRATQRTKLVSPLLLLVLVMMMVMMTRMMIM